MKLKNILAVTVSACIVSCNDSPAKQEPEDTGRGARTFVPVTEAKPMNSLPDIDDEGAKKRALLFAGIDSSYAAIYKLDEIKNEINEETAVAYTAQERNLRSKSILQLNMLSNMLARRVDSSMLINLKAHTQQLQGINDGIAKNVEHLKTLTDRLTRAASILERVTNILAGCVSAGLIRPAMPPGTSPAQVKAGS